MDRRQDGYLAWVAFCFSRRLREFPDADAVDYLADPGYPLYHGYAAVDLDLIVGESAQHDFTVSYLDSYIKIF